LSFCVKHKKHKKKLKKRKHISNIFEEHDEFTNVVDPYDEGHDSVSHKHGIMFNVTGTFTNSQFEIQGKKSHKRKRSLHQEDMCDQQTHSKYRKVKCENVSSPEMNVQEEHCHDSSSEKQTSNEKLLTELLSDRLSEAQCSVNDQQQEKHKKKKKKKEKMLHVPASDSYAPPYSADCKQLPAHKGKKKKRHKKMRCKDVVPNVDFSGDFPTCSSLELTVHNAHVVDDDVTVLRDTTTNTSEGDQVLLVNELQTINSDDIKYVTPVYRERKSSKSKHKHRKVSTDLETESAVVLSDASSNVSVDKSSHAPTEKSTSEQCLNADDILQLLHAENALSYLHSKADVKEAGKSLEIAVPFCCSVVQLMHFMLIIIYF